MTDLIKTLMNELGWTLGTPTEFRTWALLKVFSMYTKSEP
jgi:hypothetical protein